MQLKKKKKKGTPMEQAIDSMIADTEKSEYEKLRPMLTIKIGEMNAEKEK